MLTLDKSVWRFVVPQEYNWSGNIRRWISSTNENNGEQWWACQLCVLRGVEWPGDCEWRNINSMGRFLSFLLRESGKDWDLDSHFQDADYNRSTSRFRNRNIGHPTVNFQTLFGVEWDERVIREAVEEGAPVRVLFWTGGRKLRSVYNNMWSNIIWRSSRIRSEQKPEVLKSSSVSVIRKLSEIFSRRGNSKSQPA